MYKTTAAQVFGAASILAAKSLAQQTLVPQGCMVISVSTFGDITPIPLVAGDVDGVNAPQPCAQLCAEKNMTHAAVYSQFCACTNKVEPVKVLGASSCKISCQMPFESEYCGGNTEEGDPVYNVFYIMRIDNSTMSAGVPPTAAPSVVISSPTAITSNTTFTTSPYLVTNGTNRTVVAGNVSVVTRTTTLPTCPTCTKNGPTLTPAPAPIPTAIDPACPPGGLCTFIKAISIATVIQAPDGHGMATTQMPTQSTVFYDPAESTVTTVVEMGRTRVMLVRVARVATASVAPSGLPSTATLLSTAGSADDAPPPTAAAANLLPACAQSGDASSAPTSSSAAGFPPPPPVVQTANGTTAATTAVNGTALVVTRLPGAVVASGTAASVPSDRLLVLSWLGVLAGGAFILL